MKTLERELGPDLWFKIKNILDLFLRFYYLLEVKPYEFSVFENFVRELRNILLRQYNIQVSKNCLMNKCWSSILWQQEELFSFFLMYWRTFEKHKMPSLSLFTVFHSHSSVYTILILLGQLVNIHILLLIFTVLKHIPFFCPLLLLWI